MVAPLGNPSTAEATTGRSLGLTASGPRLLEEFPASERPWLIMEEGEEGKARKREAGREERSRKIKARQRKYRLIVQP